MNVQTQQQHDPKSLLQIILVGTLLFFGALIVLQQANPARSKLGRDSGAYIYIGSHVLHGKPPYLTAWDSKPPGIFLLDAVGLWLGRGTRWGIWVIELISLTTAAILGFLAMQKHFGTGAALPASMTWLYGLNWILIGGNLTEEYSLFFGFLSIFLFILSLEKKSTIWLDAGIGLCAGASFVFRPNNIGVQISIVLTVAVLMMIERQYLALFRRLVVIGLAALLPLGTLSIYLVSKGAMQAFWEATIIYNFFSYAGAHRFNPLDAFTSGVSHLGFISHIALLGFLVAGIEFWLQVKKRYQITGVILWILLDGVIEIMFSGLSGRNYRHYFINWLPFVAFASALLIARILPWFVDWVQKRALSFLIIFTFVFCLYFRDVPGKFWKSIQPLLDHSSRVQYIDPVAEYVNVNTDPGQTILVWGGQAGINFLARRDSPVSYLFFPLGVPSKITDRLTTDYYHTLVSNPPTLIVDGYIYDDNQIIPISTVDPLGWLSEHQVYNTPYLMETLKFIRENYILLDNVNGADIYRLKQ